MTFKPTNKTFIISDTHFAHKNIQAYQGRPESHEAIMLSNWIERVGDNDDILHLGDVIMGKQGMPKRKQGMPKRWSRIISRLPGNKYLILGNHDKYDKSIYLDAGFTIIPEFIYQGVAFTHRPITDLFPGPKGDWHTNLHGHIHGNAIENHHTLKDGVRNTEKIYINVCVEVTDYYPIPLGNIINLKKLGTKA